MRRCREGVAGFFEDIPVLAMILVGVSALVASGVSLAKHELAQRSETYLDFQSGKLLESILTEIVSSSPGLPPFESALVSVNLTNCASSLPSCLRYSVSVVRLHPDPSWILTVGDPTSLGQTSTGYSSAIINASLESGLIGIFEVRVIVWRG
ncbi:MAG: hypothetical protein QXT42_01330 [Thermoplasmata archaeon]